MKAIILDIETQPYDSAKLAALAPEFKARGNLTDDAKIKKDIEQKRDDWIASAALRAESSFVCAVGYGFVEDGVGVSNMKIELLHGIEERQMICAVGNTVRSHPGVPVIGHNIKRFDVPYLRQRAAIVNAPIPFPVEKGRFFDVRDTMEEWCAGTEAQFISLKRLSFLLGLGDKEDLGDKLFWQVYQTDKKKALAYLNADVTLTAMAALRLGMFAN